MQFERKFILIFSLAFFSSLSFAISAENSEYNITLFWNSFFGVYSSDIIATNPYSAGIFAGALYSGYLGPLHFSNPTVFAQSPANGASDSTPLFLTCNASDDLWLKNITFYGDFSGSWTALETDALEGQVDYGEYTLNSAPAGTYNWNCYACDISGFCAWGTNYTLNINVSIPYVTLHKPANSYANANTNVDFECNASGTKNITQIKLQVWNSTNSLYHQNISTMNTKNATGIFSSSFAPGNYSWNCIAMNEQGNNGTASSNFTFRILAASGPQILQAQASPEIIINGSNEYLYISSYGADSLWAEVLLPNSSSVNVTLTNNANTTFAQTSLVGAYNVSFFAQNTSTNETDFASATFFADEEQIFDLEIVDEAGAQLSSRLEIYSGSSVYYNATQATGIFSVSIAKGLYDVAISAYGSKAYAIFEGFNISEEDGKAFGISEDSSLSPNETLYSFNSSFGNYSTKLKIDYSAITTPVAFYKCENFDFSASNCTGAWASASASTDGTLASFSVNSLSSIGLRAVHTAKSQNDDDSKPKIKATVSGKCVEESVEFEVSSKGNPISAKISITTPRGSIDIAYSDDDGKATYKADYEGKYSAVFSKKGYSSYDKKFSLEQCIECERNNDCAYDEVCSSGKCIKVPCSCGYYENHKCINYECCSNSQCALPEKGLCLNHACVQCISSKDCNSDEICSNNQCTKLDCICGYAEGHSCVNYECCSNSQCSADQKCNVQEHKCESYIVKIIAPKTADEGSEIKVQLQINGEPGANQEVNVNGKPMVTDANGYLIIIQGYEDTVIEYKGEVTKIESILTLKNLDLIIPETEIFKDDTIEITLKNSKGSIVEGNIEIITPDGRVLKYPKASSVTLKALAKGAYKISANAPGYKTVEYQQVNAGSCELLSIDYGKWNFIFTACWYWHVLVVIILIILILFGTIGGGLSYYFYKKSKSKSDGEAKKKYHGYKTHHKMKQHIEKIKKAINMHHAKKYSFRR